MVEQEGPDLEKKTSFKDKFEIAFQLVVDDSKNQHLLERFRESYEYRKNIPWLEEAQEDGGLAGALKRSFALYLRSPGKIDESLVSPVDSDFKQQLKDSTKNIPEDSVDLERFKHFLESSHIDTKKIEPNNLKKHIKRHLTITAMTSVMVYHWSPGKINLFFKYLI